MVSVVLLLVVPSVAVIMSHPVNVLLVVYANVPPEPLAIESEAGTCSPVLLDFSVTVSGEAVAPERPTVHVPEAPGRTEVGLQVSPDRVGGGGGTVSESVVVALLEP
jgi:hypothetical protein